MDMQKMVPVREQDPKVRATNFDEVCLGYSREEAVAECQRCIQCKNPRCVKGCPVGIDIPGFIRELRDEYKALLKDGYIDMLLDAGVRLLEFACGPCCAIGQTPPTNGVSVRTSNRNFPGRSGSRSQSRNSFRTDIPEYRAPGKPPVLRRSRHIPRFSSAPSPDRFSGRTVPAPPVQRRL